MQVQDLQQMKYHLTLVSPMHAMPGEQATKKPARQPAALPLLHACLLAPCLAQVSERWKSIEFVVVAYKDAKDTWMLGSVDDVASALDDSNLILQTITASRYVKGIK